MRHLPKIILTGILLILGAATPLWGQVFISTLGDPLDNYQNDRFIEIYNSGSCVVDLSAYSIKIYSNVSATNIPDNSDIISLSGTLNPGTAYTIGLPTSTYSHDRSGVIDPGTYGQWNGQERDGASLYFNNTLIDSVVPIPGSNTFIFANGYLERNPSICNPNPIFDGSEWTYFTADSISHSSPGSHTANCPTTTATFAIPQDSICFSADSLVLWPFVSDSSGFFSGIGVQNDSVFYPNFTGGGSIELQYNFVLPTCTIVLLDTIEVVQSVAQITPLTQDTVCQSNGPISLSGTPAGGTFYFEGAALPGNSLDLSGITSTGTYEIVYEVTNLGCSDSDTVSVHVVLSNSYSVAGIPSQIGIYEPPITFNNLGSYVLSGTGTSDSVFFPHTAGIGTHTLTLTDSTGCSSPISISIDVVDYISINNLTAPSSTSICPGDTATLIANNSGLNGTQSYSDSILPFFYRPITGGTPISFSDEDHHSGIIAIPFEFCFYGQTFDQLVVSSNGYITFDTAAAGTNSPMSAGDSIPTDALPNYCILGPWSDYNTNFGGVSYKIVGTAPHRKFILEYNDVVIWASPSYITTQIHLYESTHFIETHVLEREFYSNRELIHGLKKDSLDYHIIPGRNYQVTSIFNESRRFYPDGAGDVVWFDDSGNLIASGDTLRVSPTDSTSYTVLAGCALNDTVGLSSEVFVHVNPNDTAFITNTIDTICSSDAPFAITSSIPGTTFEINGNSATSIDPNTLPMGSNLIVSFPPSSAVCGIGDTLEFHVEITDTANIVLNADTLCEGTIYFISAFPLGGVYSGTGVDPVTGVFDGSIAGPGTHTIFYSLQNNCSLSDSMVLVVNPADTAVLNASVDTVCPSDNPYNLGTYTNEPSPTFTINGILESNFDPSAYPPGSNVEVILHANGTSCSIDDTLYIYIRPITQPQIDQVNTTLCENAGNFNLSGNLPGAIFNGIGVIGNQFYPSAVALFPGATLPDTVQILYGDITAQNCVIFDTLYITVIEAPIATISNIPDSICSDDLPFNPTISPLGGQLTLDGIPTSISSSIDPSTLSTGNHTLSYTYTDGSGCSVTESTTFTLFNANPVSISLSKDTLCADNTSFTLTASLAGGEWMINGMPIVGDQIIPINYLGTNQVIYNYGIGTPCPSSDTASLEILPLPNLTMANLPDSICFNANPIGLLATPNGGTFFGTGVSQNTFDPLLSGIGDFQIGYTYTNGAGCTDSIFETITVYQDTGLSFDIQPDTLCISSGIAALNATPTGGLFIGPGVTGSSFDPLAAGVGTHVLKYVLPAGFCTDTLYDTTLVESPLSPGQSSIIYRCIGNISSVNLFNNILGNPDTGGTWVDPNGVVVSNGIVSGSTALDGIYTYTVANSCGTFTSQVTLNINPEPIVNGAGPVVISPGQSATLPTNYIQGNNLQYNWSPGLSLIDSTVNTPTTVPLFSNTTFVFTVEDSITGCQDTGLVAVLVNMSPLAINPTASQTVVCEGGSTTLNANASGGTTLYQYLWSPGNIFLDSTVANPTATITQDTWVYLTATDGSDSVTDSLLIQVETAVPVQLPPISSICTNSGQQNIDNGATPAGGIFSGPGIVNGFIGIFDPLIAGSGTHNIVYSYTSNNGCTYTDTQQVVVNIPTQLTVLNSPFFCLTSSPDTLDFILPSGGSYSGSGVINNIFDPAVSGVGNHPVQYTYTDSNGCQTTISASVTVGNSPNVTLNSLGTICENQNPFALNNGSPGGGIYSGPGVANDSLFPTLLSPGTYTLTYTYTSGSGCTGQATRVFIIDTIPDVTFTSPGDICLNAGPTLLNTGFPSGGSYSGPGVVGGQFIPSNVGLGSYIITYTYTNSTGCSQSDTAVINVINPTPISFSNIPQYCISDGPDTLNYASPTGGVYSGNGVSNGVFNPQTAGVGNHQILYTYTDSNQCTVIASSNIVVYSNPGVYLNSLTPRCYDDAPFALNQGFPSGGQYSGPGVINDTLYPNLAGPGTHTLTYTFTNTNGCSDSATTNLVILGPPNLNYPSLDTICLNSGNLPINIATPTGGSYSGPGVTNGIFNPNIAGLGTHSIQYIFTNSNGCSDTISSDITVTNPTPVSWSNFDSTFCVTESAFSLLGLAQPGGGTYSGAGVSNNIFNPALAGPGTHNITYTYQDANGCSASGVKGIVIVGQPTVSIASLPSVCVNAAPFALSGGLPSGGTYFGTGVSNNTFDPSVAGSGNTTIGYSFANALGCRDTAYQTITVEDIPTLTQIPYGTYCQDSNPVQLTGGNPGGGTYFGTDVFAGFFYPATAGAGTHTVYYRYQNNSGCADTISFEIEVTPLPVVQLNPIDTVCSRDTAFALTQGIPAGGNYSGPGVVNNTFYPDLAGHGNHVITYTYVDSNGCSNFDKKNLHVILSPPIPIITENGNYLVCNWGFYQYQWYLDGVPIPGANAISHLPDQPGYYSVVITNAAGCWSSSGDYYLDIISNAENELQNTVVYPNPSTGKFVLEFAKTVTDGTITIWDSRGSIVMKKKLINLGRVELDLSGNSAGVYTLTVESDKQFYYEKLILEK